MSAAPLPMIERVLLLVAEDLVLWSRFRPKMSDLALDGVGDIGRIIWIVRFFRLDTVDALLAGEARREYSLDSFGRALRASSADTEFQLWRHTPPHTEYLTARPGPERRLAIYA